ncbi:hypothetical protein CPB84DRAFT_1859225 [Gymnopilus junonius]|uniref:Peptidase metallopeptidase domain-containing protein n=1 Tax=Gymnopilus junonius TaxID=109634 RepID=A0A9P5N6W7_GYMJU|nr:hypothetical protein CPB84DRAFT_1859225 [Gymnopilus junonius]
MSSTPNSTQIPKIIGVDIPYIRHWGHDCNPFQIASLGSLWQPTDIINNLQAPTATDAVNPAPVGNTQHEITFTYFAPLLNGARDPAHAGTADQHTKVEATIKEWERYMHISFISADVAVATICISFVPANGNWLLVSPQHTAYAGANEKMMNLGGLNPAGALASDYERHVILHEFGHSLGLLHKHQSLAYATSGDENIYAELKHELSDMDKAFMVINYPRVGERINSVYPREGGGLVKVDNRAWTMEYALNTAGLTEAAWPDVRASILTKYADLNAARTNEIWEIFGEWTKARREEERAARAAAAANAAADNN